MTLLPPELRPLFPFRHHFLKLDGHRMHYVDEGQGPPVVLLHGNPTWSFYYRSLIAGLKDRFRVIAPDHLGCGLSDKPQRYPYTLANHIENLERLMDHLSLDPFSLCVHDWGGPIGFGYACRHADRIRRLVVFNSAAFLEGKMPLRIRACRWPVLGELTVRGLNLFARCALFMASTDRRRMTKDVRRGYLWPYGSYADRVAIHRFVRDIPKIPRRGRSGPFPGVLDSTDPLSKMDSSEIVARIDRSLSRFSHHPMMIFWGERDFCFADSFLESWRRRFPHAVVHRFADAGHYVVEDADERILPLLRDFLFDQEPDRPSEN